jgi:hypothetical protein
MSSSRSIAGARQRRAGEAPPVGQRGPGPNTSKAFLQPQGGQQQQGNQLPPQAPVVPVGKLAIGDAFALVTIRLGRIETIIQKLEAEGVIGPNAPHNTGQVMEHDENMRLVDDTVIRNIISRLGDLEKGQTKLSTSIQTNVATPVTFDTTELDQRTADLQDQIVRLKDDLRETKELLMKLQSFSMETNQKMISVILTQEKQESLLKQGSANANTQAVSMETPQNLKQDIENELANTNFDENVADHQEEPSQEQEQNQESE